MLANAAYSVTNEVLGQPYVGDFNLSFFEVGDDGIEKGIMSLIAHQTWKSGTAGAAARENEPGSERATHGGGVTLV